MPPETGHKRESLGAITSIFIKGLFLASAAWSGQTHPQGITGAHKPISPPPPTRNDKWYLSRAMLCVCFAHIAVDKIGMIFLQKISLDVTYICPRGDHRVTPYSTTKNVLGCGLLPLSLCPPPPPLPFPTPFQPFHALLHCIIPLLPSRSISSPSPSSGPQRENCGQRGAHAHKTKRRKKKWRAAHDFLVFFCAKKGTY